MELYGKNGWSIDVGLTKGHVLAGMSKDVYKDIVDVNLGVSASKERQFSYYGGVSLKF